MKEKKEMRVKGRVRQKKGAVVERMGESRKKKKKKEGKKVPDQTQKRSPNVQTC